MPTPADRKTRRLLLLAPLFGAACTGSCQDWDRALERMVDQPKYEAFEESAFFPDGKAMQAPPEGTVPRERDLALAHALAGQERLTRRRASTQDDTEGPGQAAPPAPALTMPVPTRSALERGRERFDIYCAPCHGILGDGDSPVAQHMQLRRPPSLLSPAVVARPAAQLFQIVSAGYGLMPRYDYQLSASDRWDVVAYLGALQRSQGVHLSELPEPLRAEALRTLGAVPPPP